MYDLQMKEGIAVVTLDHLPGHQITGCYGIVHGTAIFGANFMKDFWARARDTIGGRVGSYERTMQAAQREAVVEMIKMAKDTSNCNAIIGVRITMLTAGNAMMIASAQGTAVTVTNRG